MSADLQHKLKHIFDRVAAVLLLVTAAPIFLFAALLIKAFSRGPVFFTQERVGWRQEPFKIYKLRTMRVGGSSDLGSSVTVRNDPRFFPGAKLLRALKIDELPQLINVLNGSMSLVGPRPTVREDYDRMTPEQQRRSAAKPGITGLAQVSGGASITWPRRIQYDLAYIDNYSLALDLKILFITALLTPTGRAEAAPIEHDEWGDDATATRLPTPETVRRAA